MTGLHDTDIKLGDSWELSRAADGDAPLVSEYDCFYQSILLEALTQEGDLFYDSEFGWSLYDFLQSEDDSLTRLEIIARARQKLLRREVIVPDSIEISVEYEEDSFRLVCSFRFEGESKERSLGVEIGAVSVEVIDLDR